MRYTLLVTGPAYGSQQASSALLFAKKLIELKQDLKNIFFYREGVLNANKFITPASDEYDMVREWQYLHNTFSVKLQICISAALRRGIVDMRGNTPCHISNLQGGFELTGISDLTEAIIHCDRLIQF
ncbi:sulfurtransferase complex subunit TusD [Candidatus Ishikawella capsulata]|uniref:Uncharacterized protein n=1 Tax=Candidatus Ishikawaella capsulata Mpkobe TaxID=476281 RepID=C5WCP7_9ENTR|nr:sulfurtransferase complex subunit TusD [Candidatus Ishikawaella capsulata]BAH83103.1 hypothetical protein tusD [Candidatus Ishikawaella capsulata Mpkobe]